ncbi:hypothetical protein LIER_07632 [Lithospermum erythrorhizon]|uniref:Uncharacterized protein n=1 Tax=Lithospermum erythrorhizon TaxID=34254 RepID=A0AAV3PCS4_LITER
MHIMDELMVVGFVICQCYNNKLVVCEVNQGSTSPYRVHADVANKTPTDKYTYIVVPIEESQDVEAMIVDELQGSLNMHEQKFHRFTKESDDQVLKVENKFSNLNIRGRSSGLYRGNGSYRGKGRSGGRA